MNSDNIKKSLSENKKRLIICGIALAVLVLIISIIAVSVHNYRTPDEYEVQTLQFTEMTGNTDIKLIAHRGYRAIAPENTHPAFELAGQAGYWGAECDVYRTKDGTWIINHDPNTFRLMNKKKKIEKTDLSELQKLYYKYGNNIQNYQDLKLCTLEEYLDICAQFNLKAVIELKGDNNTDHYDEIVNLTKQYNVEPLYISYEKSDLESMRKLTDAKMFYLSDTISDKAIKTAKEIGDCGIEINAGEEKNFAGDAKLIKKAQKEGLEVAAWNVNDLDTMRTLLKNRVLYFTTDSITY